MDLKKKRKEEIPKLPVLLNFGISAYQLLMGVDMPINKPNQIKPWSPWL